MQCRHCSTSVTLTVVDLGTAPPSNAYLGPEQLIAPEAYFPLRVLVCTSCWLMQTEDYSRADELFYSGYAYFSSYSSTWLTHAEAYVEKMVKALGLNSTSLLIEVASNDGYLLQFSSARGIPSLGIEPTASTAAAARAKGLDVIEEFFGVSLATRLAAAGRHADLLVANNVLGHVPDVNDFVGGFAVLLKPTGVATFEFPHLHRLMESTQFDTIYHEHYSYLSLTAVKRIFETNGLTVFDVEELPTHGGSLRVYAQRRDGPHPRPTTPSVAAVLVREEEAGMTTAPYYAAFQERADAVKNAFVAFLIDARQRGKKVGAYGAAAKGNTLLNYGGVKKDLLPYVVDRNPAKQHKYLPGSRIPVVTEDQLRADRPDFIVILPWNLRDEVIGQLAYARDWGAQFVTSSPALKID
jgi:SAM-dependent methyltransferase